MLAGWPRPPIGSASVGAGSRPTRRTRSPHKDATMGAGLTLSGPEFPPAGRGRASRLVLLLHGYGADGRDLLGLAPHWVQRLPDTAFLAPNAPFPCEMGFGYQWF